MTCGAVSASFQINLLISVGKCENMWKLVRGISRWRWELAVGFALCIHSFDPYLRSSTSSAADRGDSTVSLEVDIKLLEAESLRGLVFDIVFKMSIRNLEQIFP